MKKTLTLLFLFSLTVSENASAQSCFADFSSKINPSTKTVVFTNISKFSNSYLWDFGDGQTSTLMNPTHIYGKNDNYWVTLTAKDTIKKCSESKRLRLSVKNCDADFEGYENKFMGYLFYAYEYFSGVKHTWTYNGIKDTSDYYYSEHLFTSKGAYSICHTIDIISKGCKDTVCKTFAINPACPSDFNTVQWIPNSINYSTYIKGVPKVKVDFGDGNTSNLDSSSHKYKPGTYNMCITAYCSSTDSSVTCKTVQMKAKDCVADFTSYAYDTAHRFKFVSYSTKSVTKKYHWDFGDGSSSSDTSPVHSYKEYKTYTACLTIKDSAIKCADSLCIKNEVVCHSYHDVHVNNYDTTMDYFSLNKAWKTKWDFGDGTTSSSATGKHKYSKYGNYYIYLTVYCSSKDSSVSWFNRTITPTCIAYFKVVQDTTQKFKLYLMNKSSYRPTTRYHWYFGDGTSVQERFPTHKYSKFGKYEVCIAISDNADNCGYSDYCDTIGIDSNGILQKKGEWEIIVIEEGQTGIDKLITSDFKIYPNPANTKISIELYKTNLRFDKLEIISLTGQVCISQSLNNNEKIDVNVESLNRGLYLIKLSNSEGYSFDTMMKN